MTDREIFKKNLNYYLSVSGKMQKDLAEYVGAKTTTVSGWTRGVSFPRADAMEKIAMFFGIPTSRLVSDSEDPASSDSVPAPTEDLRVLFADLSKLSPDQQKQARQLFRAAFMLTNPELFAEGDDDD